MEVGFEDEGSWWVKRMRKWRYTGTRGWGKLKGGKKLRKRRWVKRMRKWRWMKGWKSGGGFKRMRELEGG
jgi:hypothetical protein